MNILVTGGAGYIGSHTCVALLKEGNSIVIADNLSNSRFEVIDRVKQIVESDIQFIRADMTNDIAVENIFAGHRFDAVIHFAGLKAVGESVVNPLQYYYNNVVSTINLSMACQKYNINKFVFSSSATVYGNNKSPLVETMPLLPVTNPYGRTKVVSEQLLTDLAAAFKGLSVSLLRYFNPVGAHESGMIGEAPRGIPNNLMPYITRVAKGELSKLIIFGNDYPTVDGTGVRDYIHVMDLAEGHMAALNNMTTGVSIFNLGTGRGVSVLQLLKAFEEANQIAIPFEFAARRAGDVAECYADVYKVEKLLGWKARRNLYDMCRDAWRFEQGLKK